MRTPAVEPVWKVSSGSSPCSSSSAPSPSVSSWRWSRSRSTRGPSYSGWERWRKVELWDLDCSSSFPVWTPSRPSTSEPSPSTSRPRRSWPRTPCKDFSPGLIYLCISILLFPSTVAVDAVVYFKIFNPMNSVINVQNANQATRLLASTTLRNMLGTKNLHVRLLLL